MSIAGALERADRLAQQCIVMAMAGKGAEASALYHLETCSDLMLDYALQAEQIEDPRARAFHEQLADAWWHRLCGRQS